MVPYFLSQKCHTSNTSIWGSLNAQVPGKCSRQKTTADPGLGPHVTWLNRPIALGQVNLAFLRDSDQISPPKSRTHTETQQSKVLVFVTVEFDVLFGIDTQFFSQGFLQHTRKACFGSPIPTPISPQFLCIPASPTLTRLKHKFF